MDFSSSGELRVESLRPDRPARGARSRWLTPRAVAFAGALLFAFAAWAPWVAGTFLYSFGEGAGQQREDFSADSSFGWMIVLQRSLRGPDYLAANAALLRYQYLWGFVTSAGVLLAPLLWRRAADRWRRYPLYAFGMWLAAATLATLVLAATLLTFVPELPPGEQIQITVAARSVGWGLDLTAVALGALWYALMAQLREERASAVSAPATSARAPIGRRHRAAGAALSAGIVVWAVGFFAVPWAAVNCVSLPLTLNHYSAGACGTLDSADALVYQVARQISQQTWNLSAGIYPLYGILIGGALLLLAAIWLRPASRDVLLWATVWLLLATVAAFLAYRGVGVIITNPPALSSAASGAWNGATGVAVTLLGLLVAWAAVIPLDGARWWRIAARPVAAPVSSQTANSSEADDGFEVSRL